jgi:hypothetical protein
MSYIGLLSDTECRGLWDRQDEITKDYDEGRYAVSVFSKLSPRNVQVLDGNVKEFTFPTFTYLRDMHIPTEDRKKLESVSYYHARRIRNYLHLFEESASPPGRVQLGWRRAPAAQ